MPAKIHRITQDDIAAPALYAAERAERRRALIPIKRNRRIEVGPYATFYFENFATMLAQVQEMLHVEKGGAAQIPGELEAYNPLIPQGAELIATLMIEIDEPDRRLAMLMKLAGIEESVALTIGARRIAATPTDYEDRTTPEGKTSSVHWVRFSFTPQDIAAFKNPILTGAGVWAEAATDCSMNARVAIAIRMGSPSLVWCRNRAPPRALRALRALRASSEGTSKIARVVRLDGRSRRGAAGCCNSNAASDLRMLQYLASILRDKARVASQRVSASRSAA